MSLYDTWGGPWPPLFGHPGAGYPAFATLALATLAFTLPFELSTNKLCLHASRLADL